MHFRLGIFTCVMCVSYSSLCFSFLVLGSFPRPHHGAVILMAFYSSLFFFFVQIYSFGSCCLLRKINCIFSDCLQGC